MHIDAYYVKTLLAATYNNSEEHTEFWKKWLRNAVSFFTVEKPNIFLSFLYTKV